MPLDGLLELVETLKQRIVEYKAELSQSEAQTRYALIDPFLRGLGWDTSDPGVVAPEYRVPNGMVADYALLVQGKPVMIIESKKLDEPLQGGKALDQGILYSTHSQLDFVHSGGIGNGVDKALVEFGGDFSGVRVRVRH